MNKVPRSFPFARDHPIATLWPRLSYQITDILGDLCFLNLNVYNWGLDEQSARLTIILVLYADDVLSSHEAESLQQSIKEVCLGEYAGSLDISIEYGSFESTIRNARHLDFPGRKFFKEKIPMGHSIGIDDGDTGTLGGYLELTNPIDESRKVVFLTSSHVLRQATKLDDEPQFSGSWPHDHTNMVLSPSRDDIRARLVELHECVEILKRKPCYVLVQERVLGGTVSDSTDRVTIESRRQSVNRKRRCESLSTLVTATRPFWATQVKRQISGIFQRNTPRRQF